MTYKKVKFSNYEALFIHKKGNRTGGRYDFAHEALKAFKRSKTAIKCVVFKATHNNTRLKKFTEYDEAFKN
jgi:hypothetical protein